MCIGIISAMWVEAERLHAEMENVTVYEYAGMKYYKGMLRGKEVVLSVSGIGKVNASIYTQIMIDKFSPSAIIQTGIAGSMDKAAEHLSVVVAESLTYHSVCKQLLRMNFPYSDEFKADEALSSALVDAAGDALRGLIITGDDFISDPEKKKALKAEFPSSLCVEMEGCAVANTAFLNGIPFAIMRCISDLAESAMSEDYADFERLAANKAAEILLSALEKI